MKYYEVYHHFPHNWGQTSFSFLNKYPNLQQPHVESVWTVNRQLISPNKLLMKRILFVRYPVPSWVAKITGIHGEGIAAEHILIDADKELLELYSRNHTMSDTALVEENCVYSASKNRPGTDYKQRASYTFHAGFISSKLESLACDYSSKLSHVGIDEVDNRTMWTATHEALEAISGNFQLFAFKMRRPAQEIISAVEFWRRRLMMLSEYIVDPANLPYSGNKVLCNSTVNDCNIFFNGCKY